MGDLAGQDAADGALDGAQDAASSTDTAAVGESSGDTLLTRGAADGDDGSTQEPGGADLPRKSRDAGEDEKASSDADPALLVPDKPEGYDLKFAKDVAVDEALLKSFKSKAHELGIPQGKAQRLADFYTTNMGESAKAMRQAQLTALTEAKKGWETEIASRPGYQREVADARRTLKEFGSDALNEIMDQTLLGSHPVFFDFMVRVGKALAEPDSRGAGNAGGKDKPLADRLWPNM